VSRHGWDSDLGASCGSWRDMPQPESVWAELCWQGFTTKREMFSALAQFGRIDTCNWARRMTMEPEGAGFMSTEGERIAKRARLNADHGADFVREFPPQPLLPEDDRHCLASEGV
jgi:hypothetical protein